MERKDASVVMIGDEVVSTASASFIVTCVELDSEEELWLNGFNKESGAIFRRTLSECRKTGNHYPEVAALIMKAKRERDKKWDAA